MPGTSISLAEFRVLQEQVELLRGEVHSLHNQLSITKTQLRALQVSFSEAFEEERDSTFTLVSEIRSSEAPVISASYPQPSQAPSIAASVPAATQLETSRAAAARQIGQFLRRAVSGHRRGSSGRDLIPQASRYWLVVRSFDEEVFDPVRVYSKWEKAKPVVKRGSDLGDSVFIGLPALEDIRIVVEAGGFSWAGAIEA